MSRVRAHFIVIDPAMRIAETECFNRIALTAPLPCTYHLPAIHGMQSLQAEDLASAKGMIVLGSASSVHDRSDWQRTLEGWLRPLLDRGLPTLGICYGHQMLAHMYGGKVGYLHADQAKDSGFRDIELTPFPGSPWKGSKGPVAVSHCETVTEAPAVMAVFATGPGVPTDGLRHRDLPIFSFQSHPEATVEFLKNHEIPSERAPLAYGHGLVQDFLAYAAGR